MLIGSANHSIDAKGRYIVPAKFRADLGDRFVVTQGVGGCLFAFSLEQWNLVSRRLAELPASDKNTLNFKRRFFSRAFELELDSQSRAVLPHLLRELAQIDKDVVSVGMVSRIEIWSKDRWDAVEQDQELPEDEGTSILAGLVL